MKAKTTIPSPPLPTAKPADTRAEPAKKPATSNRRTSSRRMAITHTEDTRNKQATSAVPPIMPIVTQPKPSQPPLKTVAASSPGKASSTHKSGKSAKPTSMTKSVKAATAKSSKAASKKIKLIRDSFTIPENEYQQIAVLKGRVARAGAEIKKSELLRLGLKILSSMSDSDLLQASKTLEKLKTGRPAK